MADTADLKSASFGSAGSIPAPDTSFSRIAIVKSKLRLDKSLICPPEFFLFTFFLRCKNGDAHPVMGLPSLRSALRRFAPRRSPLRIPVTFLFTEKEK